MLKSQSALLIIDVQNDFCLGGKLAVPEGDDVIPVINSIISSVNFDRIVATQDWHPDNHISFAKNHEGKKVGDIIEINGISQYLWPEHCVAGSYGAEFCFGLDIKKVDIIIRKGINPEIDSYSAFFENDKRRKTGLDGYLKSLDIKNVYICGLATDYCVFYSAMDSKNLGFETFVIIDACRGVDLPAGNLEKALKQMKENGIIIIKSKDLK